MLGHAVCVSLGPSLLQQLAASWLGVMQGVRGMLTGLLLARWQGGADAAGRLAVKKRLANQIFVF